MVFRLRRITEQPLKKFAAGGGGGGKIKDPPTPNSPAGGGDYSAKYTPLLPQLSIFCQCFHHKCFQDMIYSVAKKIYSYKICKKWFQMALQWLLKNCLCLYLCKVIPRVAGHQMTDKNLPPKREGGGMLKCF